MKRWLWITVVGLLLCAMAAAGLMTKLYFNVINLQGDYQTRIISKNGREYFSGTIAIHINRVHYKVGLTRPFIWAFSAEDDMQTICSLSPTIEGVTMLDSFGRRHYAPQSKDLFHAEWVDSTGHVDLTLKPLVFDSYIEMWLQRDDTGLSGWLHHGNMDQNDLLAVVALTRK